MMIRNESYTATNGQDFIIEYDLGENSVCAKPSPDPHGTGVGSVGVFAYVSNISNVNEAREIIIKKIEQKIAKKNN